MKKLRILLIGFVLVGAFALVGCSRYNAAHEAYGRGRSAESLDRSLEQNGRGRSHRSAAQGNLSAGELGRQQYRPDSAGELLGRNGAVEGPEGRIGNGRFLDREANAPLQSGRSVVARASLGDLAGTLRYDGSEWYLDTGESTYMLHFGNSAYVESTGIDLQEGDLVEVRGFIDGKEVAVVTASVDSGVFTFRNEDGAPMWAGRGRREGRVARPYVNRRGAGQLPGQPMPEGGGGPGVGWEFQNGS